MEHTHIAKDGTVYTHTRMRKHTNTVTHIPTLTITKAQRQF